MKNLMTYTHPSKAFTNSDWNDETETLVKIQIDNSLALGWRREDIVLATNFPYSYNGVDSIVIGDEGYCTHSSGTPSKISAILELYDRGLIENDIYFFHDFDAFQLLPFDALDLISGGIALTQYGYVRRRPDWLHRWSTGVIFFDKDSKQVFDWIHHAVYKYMANEEVSLLAMTRHNKWGINERIRILDIAYNFATRRRDIERTYEKAEKPLKVIHFHPSDPRILSSGFDNMDTVMRGKNHTGKPFATDLLIEVMAKHGIKT